jgi:hypothetical protein
VSSPQELIEKLKVLERVGDDTSLSIMPMLPLVVIPHTNEVHSMRSPCIGASRPWILMICQEFFNFRIITDAKPSAFSTALLP